MTEQRCHYVVEQVPDRARVLAIVDGRDAVLVAEFPGEGSISTPLRARQYAAFLEKEAAQ